MAAYIFYSLPLFLIIAVIAIVFLLFGTGEENKDIYAYTLSKQRTQKRTECI